MASEVPVKSEDEGFTVAERQKYATLAAVVFIAIAAMWLGLDPLVALSGLGGLFAGLMIDPHA